MAEGTSSNLSRRRFLGGTLGVAGTVPFGFSLSAAASATTPAAVGTGYRGLTATEAAFTETMVNALCPADHLTPNGVDSGLADFIDAHLAGELDAGVHGQRELFRAGIAAANESCRKRFGVPFDRLAPADARQFLCDMAAGNIAAELPLSSWTSDVLDPLLKQACFSGPIYDAYGTRMFWKLFG